LRPHLSRGVSAYSVKLQNHRPAACSCFRQLSQLMMKWMGDRTSRNLRKLRYGGRGDKSQNAFTVAGNRFLSRPSCFDRLMPVCWYYRPLLIPPCGMAAEPIISKAAGLGRALTTRPTDPKHEWCTPMPQSFCSFGDGGWQVSTRPDDGRKHGDAIVCGDQDA